MLRQRRNWHRGRAIPRWSLTCCSYGGCYECTLTGFATDFRTWQRAWRWARSPLRVEMPRGSEQSIDAAAVNPGMLVAMLSWAGRLAEAKERGEGYLAHAADRQKAASLAGAWWGMALVHAMQGRPDQARRAYESARAAYENLDQHRLLAFVLRDELTFTVLPYLSDHLAERERVATAAEQAVLRGNAAGAIDEPAEYE